MWTMFFVGLKAIMIFAVIVGIIYGCRVLFYYIYNKCKPTGRIVLIGITVLVCVFALAWALGFMGYASVVIIQTLRGP